MNPYTSCPGSGLPSAIKRRAFPNFLWLDMPIAIICFVNYAQSLGKVMNDDKYPNGLVYGMGGGGRKWKVECVKIVIYFLKKKKRMFI